MGNLVLEIKASAMEFTLGLSQVIIDYLHNAAFYASVCQPLLTLSVCLILLRTLSCSLSRPFRKGPL